jgi:hypothetical protein
MDGPSLHRLATLVSGRSILWVDANRRNNDAGMDVLIRAAHGSGLPPCRFEPVRTWEEAIERLRQARYDLAITHWGHELARSADGQPCGVAERLLTEIRRRDVRVPVIVFASGAHGVENKRAAVGLGATAYTATWSALFQEIERVLV